MRLNRAQWILFALALLATGVVIGAGVHGHHQDDHSTCWLCVSSLATHALPAMVLVIALVWIICLLAEPGHFTPKAPVSHSPLSPRAPPLRFS